VLVHVDAQLLADLGDELVFVELRDLWHPVFPGRL
jgi:hypothetical protein